MWAVNPTQCWCGSEVEHFLGKEGDISLRAVYRCFLMCSSLSNSSGIPLRRGTAGDSPLSAPIIPVYPFNVNRFAHFCAICSSGILLRIAVFVLRLFLFLKMILGWYTRINPVLFYKLLRTVCTSRMTRDMLYLQCCPTDTRQREEVKSIWRILLFLFLSPLWQA